jgi:hypothetical protein
VRVELGALGVDRFAEQSVREMGQALDVARRSTKPVGELDDRLGLPFRRQHEPCARAPPVPLAIASVAVTAAGPTWAWCAKPVAGPAPSRSPATARSAGPMLVDDARGDLGVAATGALAISPQGRRGPMPFTVDEQQLAALSLPCPYRELVPTSVPTFPRLRETPGYALKWSTYWNL